MASFPSPSFPNPGESLTLTGPSTDTLTLLAQRRSTLAKDMGAPGPDAEQLDTLLRIGARTPDHGKLFPWRFIVFEGESRARFGESWKRDSGTSSLMRPPNAMSSNAPASCARLW